MPSGRVCLEEKKQLLASDLLDTDSKLISAKALESQVCLQEVEQQDTTMSYWGLGYSSCPSCFGSMHDEFFGGCMLYRMDGLLIDWLSSGQSVLAMTWTF